MCDGLALAGWAKLPAATHAEIGARLASTGALRSLDAALRLVAQHGTVAHLETVSHPLLGSVCTGRSTANTALPIAGSCPGWRGGGGCTCGAPTSQSARVRDA